MIATYCPFEETCAQLFNAFFKKYPNDELRKRTAIAMLAVMKRLAASWKILCLPAPANYALPRRLKRLNDLRPYFDYPHPPFTVILTILHGNIDHKSSIQSGLHHM